ncbi:major facilitator superfamily domain-containing protein [Lineolata rhizophorae]|uniref:Major facilitator superfamily domain-containing protein n=1 Tax=Lineolata rhizophorae TaxID=578093 RepID=A0A6A6NSP0_9PEZI|nr:major facilitator superfamily domain-containing protein [Lineolata rhizophorae]
MAASFPEVSAGQEGMYVGLIASAFALAQFATNFFWGWLSDRIGRKPVILTGTLLTAACFAAFGFCRTLPQAVVVQALMGLVNGNQGVVSTCLGEITDRSNQSRAFTYLPVVYGLGGITGPAVGGLLVFKENPFKKGEPNPYPYLLPNLFAAAILVIDLIISAAMMEESLEEARRLPSLGHRIENLFTWLWQFAGFSTRPSYLRSIGHHRQHSFESTADATADDEGEARPLMAPTILANNETIDRKEVFNRDTILILITFLLFQLCNVAYNSLYPIFGEAAPPTGRALSAKEIGLSLAFAGLVTIVFQVGVYGKVREKAGNRVTYRGSMAAFVIAFLLMPFVGYKKSDGNVVGHGKVWLWIELGIVLIIKTVASVGGLTSALLLITNSAPNHSVLGTLNGLAQTLSAAGRAVGPFISGSLFTAATRVRPKGEALAFGIFAGVAFVGFVLSFGIRSENLEAEDWDSEEAESGREDESTR